jgi:GTP pyrophosphokinase
VETTASTPVTASERLCAAFAAARALDLTDAGSNVLRSALDVAEIVRSLDADDDVVIAAMLQPLLDAKLLDREAAEKRFGSDAAHLARGLSQLGEFGLPPNWTPEQGLEPGQAEALRKMLLTVIGDVRLVVVRLAGQLQKMRAAKSLEPILQRKLATETREVYAPLANRLGVWQLKWELEDLAFRYLQPADYKRIAAALKVRRAERERYMEELKTHLRGELHAAGVDATIEGRPKHIYSIWRRSAWCTRCGNSSPESSTTTSPLPRTTAIARFTRPSSDRARSPWKSRSARMKCMRIPSVASRHIGATRKEAAPIRPMNAK